eukprot:gene50960-62324_t
MRSWRSRGAAGELGKADRPWPQLRNTSSPSWVQARGHGAALNEFHETYARDGLVIVGFYHHKSGEPLQPEQVISKARQFQFKFPIAIDTDWRTLNDWWLGSGDHKWTSVSFLIDRHGLIRHIHEGGEYPVGSKAHQIM